MSTRDDVEGNIFGFDGTNSIYLQPIERKVFREDVLAEIDSLITDMKCAKKVDADKQKTWLKWLADIRQMYGKATK